MLAANQVLHQGRYRIIAANGGDEVGGWYEAYDTVDGTSVTLRERLGRVSKVITANQLAAINAEFANGAKALSAIRHESLIPVCDYFSDVDRQYLVLESVDGDELTGFTGEDRPPVSHVMAWAEQLLNALDNLHRQNPPIIHHDIRPSNIKIAANHRAKLVAGGVPVTPASDTVTFIPGQTTANPSFNYKPLEQLWGGLDPASQRVILNSYDERSAGILLRVIDARSDLYSLGATLYHVMTGVAPIDALERSIAMLEGKTDPLPNVRDLNSEVGTYVANVFERAMSLRREDRFDSALDMLQALRSATMRLSEPPAAAGGLSLQTKAPEITVQPPTTAGESDAPAAARGLMLAASTHNIFVQPPAAAGASDSAAAGASDSAIDELSELAAEEARLAEETRRLEARRAELEAERARRGEEMRHAEEVRLAQEAESERQRAEQKRADLEAERERERSEEERLAIEAEAERERHHAKRLRLEAELEISQKKIDEISDPIQTDSEPGEEDVLTVFEPIPLDAVGETTIQDDAILSDYGKKFGSKRGVMAAAAGLVLAILGVAIWQLLPGTPASAPAPIAVASAVDETPQPTVEPTPVEQISTAEIESEATTPATVETGGSARPRPQISAVADRQKKVTPAAAKPAAAKKKLTVDDLLNDN